MVKRRPGPAVLFACLLRVLRWVPVLEASRLSGRPGLSYDVSRDKDGWVRVHLSQQLTVGQA